MKTFAAADFALAAQADRPSTIETVLVATVLLFATGILDPRIGPNIGPARINDLFLSISAGFGVILLLTRFAQRLAQMRPFAITAIIAFYCAVGISLFWSESPASGVARYLGFLLTGLWVFYVAVRYPLRDFLKILLVTLLAVAIVSATLALAVPELGQMQVFLHKGDWKGIYQQKNTFGRNMALLSTVSLFSVLFSGPRALGTVGLLIGLATLMLSGSRTAMAVCAIGIASVLFLYLRRQPWVIAGIAIVATAAVAIAALQAIVEGNPLLQVEGEQLSLLQSQVSFTGRFGLWQFAWEAVVKRPWLGYGYDGFWRVKSLGGEVVLEESWAASDAHNGYLDVVLQVGTVGLAIFLLLYSVFLRLAVRRLRPVRASYDDLFAGLILFIFLFANLTESYLLKATSIYQLLFAFSLAQLAKVRTASAEDHRRSADVARETPPHSLLRPRHREVAAEDGGDANAAPPPPRAPTPFLRRRPSA